MSIPYSDLIPFGYDPYMDGLDVGLGDLNAQGAQELPAAQQLVNSTYNAIVTAANQVSGMHAQASQGGAGPAAASLVDDLQLIASEAVRLRQQAESIRQFDATWVQQATPSNVHGGWAFGSEVDGPKLHPWNKWQIYKAAGEALQAIQQQIGGILGAARGKRDQITQLAAEHQARVQQQQQAAAVQQEQRAIQQQVTDAVKQRELDRIEAERRREEEAEARRQALEDQRLQLELQRMQAAQQAQLAQQQAQQRLLDLQAQAEQQALERQLGISLARQQAEQARLDQQIRQQEQNAQLAQRLSTNYAPAAQDDFAYAEPTFGVQHSGPVGIPVAQSHGGRAVAYGNDYQQDWYVSPFTSQAQVETASSFQPAVPDYIPEAYSPQASMGFDPGYSEVFGLGALPPAMAMPQLGTSGPAPSSDPWADSTGFDSQSARESAELDSYFDSPGTVKTTVHSSDSSDPWDDSRGFDPQPGTHDTQIATRDSGPGVLDAVGGFFSALAQGVNAAAPGIQAALGPGYAPAPAPAPKSNALPIALGVGALGLLGYAALKK